MHSLDVREVAKVLRPVGANALREPLPATPVVSDFITSQADRCDPQRSKERYAGAIETDCRAVNLMLAAKRGTGPEGGIDNFCHRVGQECVAAPRGAACRSAVRSYDTQRLGSG